MNLNKVFGVLKESVLTKRRGFKDTQNWESISDHMFKISFLCFFAEDIFPGVDINKCIKMALVHDLAEAYIGDATPHDHVCTKERHQKENEVFSDFLDYIDEKQYPKGKEHLRKAYAQYNAKDSQEALAVKFFDIVDFYGSLMIEYEILIKDINYCKQKLANIKESLLTLEKRLDYFNKPRCAYTGIIDQMYEIKKHRYYNYYKFKPA